MTDALIYVSITGLRIRRYAYTPLFWWHATRSMHQAQNAHGNILAQARSIDGVHHTLSVWENREAMLAYLRSGAHREAMRIFPKIATGKVFGMTATQAPDWIDVPRLWRERGRDV